jgi:hypothetical protein
MSIDSLTQDEREHIEYQIQVSHFAEKGKDHENALVLLILQYVSGIEEGNMFSMVEAAAKQVTELMDTARRYGKTLESLCKEYKDATEQIAAKRQYTSNK